MGSRLAFGLLAGVLPEGRNPCTGKFSAIASAVTVSDVPVFPQILLKNAGIGPPWSASRVARTKTVLKRGSSPEEVWIAALGVAGLTYPITTSPLGSLVVFWLMMAAVLITLFI